MKQQAYMATHAKCLQGERKGKILGSLLLGGYLAISALPAVADPAVNTDPNRQSGALPTYSVDDMVSAAQGRGANTIAPTRDTPNAINPDYTGANTNSINANNTATPRTSTASNVPPNQLVLNNPIIDQADVLSASEKRQLEAKLRALYQTGMAQMAVVVVPSTDGQDTFDYALQVAERWGLGKKGTDNGILMLVAVNDRKMQILTGYGVEGVLPDAALKRIIIEDITPYFKKGDYAGGITAGINRIEERLQADPDVLRQADAERARNANTTTNANAVSGFEAIIPLLIVGFIFGQFISAMVGRFIGALLTSIGVATFGSAIAGGSALVAAFIVFFLLLFFGGGGGGSRGGRGRRGGVVFFPMGGGFSGGSSGGFDGGGFGGGGFGGGGGGFGGGGAGGSW
ncbi:TPM domain-containing protein [Faucicola atlantae]|nr:TPM domain-containing protein [Moraxella atlantae]